MAWHDMVLQIEFCYPTSNTTEPLTKFVDYKWLVGIRFCGDRYTIDVFQVLVIGLLILRNTLVYVDTCICIYADNLYDI